MQNNVQNKAITNEAKQSAAGQEFHFPGSMKYRPTTVIAKDASEAETKWRKERVEIVTEGQEKRATAGQNEEKGE